MSGFLVCLPYRRGFQCFTWHRVHCFKMWVLYSSMVTQLWIMFLIQFRLLVLMVGSPRLDGILIGSISMGW